MATAMLGVAALWGGEPAQAVPGDPPCHSNFPGNDTIAHDCDYGLSYIDYDHRAHYFVVQTSDYAVTHTWEVCEGCNRFSSWTSLGGVARGKVYLNTFDSGRALRIRVWGTDRQNWCRSYNDPSSRGQWTGWYTC